MTHVQYDIEHRNDAEYADGGQDCIFDSVSDVHLLSLFLVIN